MNMSDQKQSVSSTSTSTSSKSEQKQEPTSVKNDNGMDAKNKKALEILQTKGEKEFIKHVFTGDNGERLSYAEMRMRYG